MDIVFVLLPLAIILALLGVLAFVWSVRSGQYDDLETPAIRTLFDEETDSCSETKINSNDR